MSLVTTFAGLQAFIVIFGTLALTNAFSQVKSSLTLITSSRAALFTTKSAVFARQISCLIKSTGTALRALLILESEVYFTHSAAFFCTDLTPGIIAILTGPRRRHTKSKSCALFTFALFEAVTWLAALAVFFMAGDAFVVTSFAFLSTGNEILAFFA